MDSPDLAKIGGPAVVGMYYTTAAGPVAFYPKAKEFVKLYKEKFKKDPQPYSAESYDSAAIALKAIEAAIKAGGGKMPTRDSVAKEVRKVKYSGITGEIAFDGKGDRLKAGYFILQVVSADPLKWDDNKLLERKEIAPPPLKK
jgi:branched-chain amino acid transport system substrate-binding protein